MPYLIGTDEAGYGPNLGPLTIGATVWEVPETAGSTQQYIQPDQLFAALEKAVSPTITADGRIAIADSKQLHKPGGDLSLLERGVLAAWQQCSAPAAFAAQLVSADPTLPPAVEMPFTSLAEIALPTCVSEEEIRSASNLLSKTLAENGIRLVAMQTLAIWPDQFNARLEKTDSKGELLSECTLALVHRLIAQHVPQNARAIITCDKHGGRNFYAAVLQNIWDAWVEVGSEGREESSYRLSQNSVRCQFRFLAKGERMLPIALASMCAKYVRELAMQPFNQYFQKLVPGIAHTAGYPEDAKRFWKDTAAIRKTLPYSDDQLWRRK